MEKIDILTNVPFEVSQKCLLYLKLTSILKLRSASKSWRAILQNEYFWKKLCKINKITDVTKDNEMINYNNFMNRSTISLYHERLCMYKILLARNWLRKPLALIRKPDFNITSDIVYFDDHVTVTHDFEKFKVFNAGSTLVDIFSETCPLHYKIVRKNNILIITSGTHSIFARNVTNRSYLWRRNFEAIASGSTGTALAVDGDLIAATITDRRVISLIDLSSGDIKFDISVERSVTFIEFTKKKLCCVCNGIFCVYSLENYSLIHTLLFHKNVYTFNMKLNDSYLFTISSRFGRNRDVIKIHDIDQGRTVHKFTALVYMNVKNTKLIFRDTMKSIKIVDYNNRNIIREIKTKYTIVTLSANDHFIFGACSSGVAIYDIQTGKQKRFISLKELFGVNEIHTPIYLYVTNTKLIIELSSDDVEHRCILDFDVM